jgi:hypothetical protein
MLMVPPDGIAAASRALTPAEEFEPLPSSLKP